MAGTTAVGASAFALVGCGGDDKPSSNTTTTQPSGNGATPAGSATAVSGISDYPKYTSVVKAADYIQKYNWRNLPKPKLPPRKGGNYT
ncbi:MAG: hypothetical protein LC118_09610, partial [Dehalococcoidia bacterium]|nr:hypothetical protein [Dehalococcoidia bacterium]